MANYDPPYGYDYNSIMQQPGRSDSSFQSILGLLNNYPMHNSLAYNSIFGGGKKWEGHPKNFKQPVQNLQSTWGLLRETPLNKFESAATDNAIQSFGNLIGGEGGTNPLGADKATDKLSGFMKGDTTSAGSQGKGFGLSNDPGAYINAAKDLASWGMDIADSATLKMSLPAQPKYRHEAIHDIYGYDRLRKAPGASSSWATSGPNGLGSIIDTLGKTATGAMDGLAIGGPWGALAGGVVGMGMGVGNTIAKAVTHNRDLKAINNFNRANDRNFIITQRNAFSNLDAANNTSMYRQRILGNYGAYGGAMLPRYSANAYGLGGTVEPQELMGVTTFNAGGTHETNPNGGVMIGIGENGRPNLVEEGEVRWNDFIFSKRVKPTEDVLRKYNTFMKGGFASYADMANKIIEMHKEREDSPFDKAAMNIQMQRLADAQEWEKLAMEAAENGMSPEDYLEYKQYMESRGGQPMAYGGNLFSIGGNMEGLRSGQGEDGMPYHKTTKVYYKQNNGSKGSLSDHAYVIEHYLDSLIAVPDATQSVYYGRMLDKNGKPFAYTVAQKTELAQRAKKALETDENAVYFMYDRMKELKDAFGDDLNSSDYITEATQSGDRQYEIYTPIPLDMGYAINQLGDVDIKYRKSGGEYGTDMKRNDINRQIVNFKNSPASLDYQGNISNTSTKASSTNPSNQSVGGSYYIPGGTGYSSSNYSRTDYSGDAWKPFINAREDTDIVNEFSDYYNNKYGKKYTPEKIYGLLSDGKVGPVHNEFMSFIRSKQSPSEDNVKTDISSGNTNPVASDNSNATDNAASDGSENYKYGADNGYMNKLGLTPYDAMRLAPIFSNLKSVLEQDPPDYTYSNQLASLYRPVSYRPTGQYMRYMPIDQHYLDTMANQQRNTLYGFYRNNAMTPSAANYYATLASTQMGSQAEQAYRNSVLQNNQNRNNVLQYNNHLDAANENARRQTEMANNQNYANIMAQSYAAAEEERLAVEAAREANLQNLYNNIGLVGRELSDRYYVSKNPALAYGPMGIYYKKPEMA